MRLLSWKSPMIAVLCFFCYPFAIAQTGAPPPVPLTITTTALPSGVVGLGYLGVIAVTGGRPPYVRTVTAGSLPAGLTLNANNGGITGTPSVVGTSNFTVQVTDNTLAGTISQALSITINSSLAITTSSLPSGSQSVAYNATLAASGGTAPYTWSIAFFSLPPGLSLDPKAGTISGTPTSTGSSTFIVEVQDSTGATAETPLNITINTGQIALASYDFPTASSWPMSDWTTDFVGDGGLPDWTAPDQITASAPDLAPEQSYQGHWNGSFPSYDQWLQFRYVGSTGGAPGGFEAQVRVASDNSNGIALAINPPFPGSGFNGGYSLVGFDLTPFTDDLGDGVTGQSGDINVNPGDLFRLEAQGTQVRAYQNETLLAEGSVPGPSGSFGTVLFAFPSGGGAPYTLSFGDLSLGTFEAPFITINTPLWYFGPGNGVPSGFNLGNVTGTLTAGLAGDGTYTWTVTQGTSELNFENGSTTITKTNVNTVGVQTVGFSNNADDVTVTLQYSPSSLTGATTTINYSLTIDSPYQLVPNGSPTHAAVANCVPPQDGSTGWQSLIPYNIVSRFGKLITNIGVNESFGAFQPDYPGENWTPPTAGGTLVDLGFFVDNMCHTGTSTTPPTFIPQVPLGSTAVQHAAQSWFVGSTSSGSGIEVQTNTHQRFQDHGMHTGITSPVR